MRSYARQRNISVVSGEQFSAEDFSHSSSPLQSTQGSEIIPLFLWFNGQRHMIDIPRFIIGRGGEVSVVT